MIQHYDYWSSDLNSEAIEHFGILGMKWGIRRYQNPDGSLTAAGRKRYLSSTNSNELNAKGKDVLDTWQRMHYGVRSKTREKVSAEVKKNKEYAETDAKVHEYYKKKAKLTEPIDTELTDAYYNIRKDPNYSEDEVAQIVNPNPKSQAFKNYFGKEFINKNKDTLNKIAELDDEYAGAEAKLRTFINYIDEETSKKVGSKPEKITDISVAQLEKLYKLEPGIVNSYVDMLSDVPVNSIQNVTNSMLFKSYALF